MQSARKYSRIPARASNRAQRHLLRLQCILYSRGRCENNGVNKHETRRTRGRVHEAKARPFTMRDYARTLSDYASRYDEEVGPLPCFPPPAHESALPAFSKRGEMPPAWEQPFISTDAGALPRGLPSCADEAVALYLVSGAARTPPNIDVDFESVECSSNGEARRVIASAASSGQVFWSAVHVPGIEHPRWWPRSAAAVPGFEHMIIGVGAAGIGMHRDRYCAGGGDGDGASSERLVSTYLALGRGRKHVVLLPPTEAARSVAEELGGDGCDDTYGRQRSQRAKLPARPSPSLLERVIGAGGFWFDIEAASSAREGDGEGGSDGGGEGDGDGDGKGDGGEVEEEEEEEAALAEGAAGDDGDEGDGEEGDDEEEEEDDTIPVALFIPSGWWHWLVGDSEWHVAWSGSIFPKPIPSALSRGARANDRHSGAGKQGRGYTGGRPRTGGRQH